MKTLYHNQIGGFVAFNPTKSDFTMGLSEETHFFSRENQILLLNQEQYLKTT
jgi:hypothetical protein